MKCWKQPTPVDINDSQLDFLERSLIREILSLCQNEKTLLHFEQAKKYYSVELKRGQCIVKVAKIAKDLKIGRKRVRKSIENVSKWYSQMNIQGMPYGLIITVLKYDELTNMNSQMDNEGTMKGQWRDNERTPNKSVKSVENDKSVEISLEKEKIEKIQSSELATQNEVKDIELAQLLYALIKKNNPAWNVKPNWDTWQNDIRKLREIDERTHKQIEYAIRWAQKDNFWWSNILSPAKLRKQFNSLICKAKSNQDTKKREVFISPAIK